MRSARSKTHSKYDNLQHYISTIFSILEAIFRHYILDLLLGTSIWSLKYEKYFRDRNIYICVENI
jgi:hypothetical protein